MESSKCIFLFGTVLSLHAINSKPCFTISASQISSKTRQNSSRIPNTYKHINQSIKQTRKCKIFMATTQLMQRKQLDHISLSSPLLDPRNADSAKSRGLLLEKKIDYLESVAGKVSRRSRKWMNDRLLIELVPRLNAEEIRGLFAPPPWGEDVVPSSFCKNSVGAWDKLRNGDVDVEVDISDGLESSCSRRKGHVDSDQMAVLNAWHRIDYRTREALRRSYLTELIDNYESCIRAFIIEDRDEAELVLKVQDPFHRLLLHGVSEFYNLESITVPHSNEEGSLKMTKIKKKKKTIALELPNITLCRFLKMFKERSL